MTYADVPDILSFCWDSFEWKSIALIFKVLLNSFKIEKYLPEVFAEFFNWFDEILIAKEGLVILHQTTSFIITEYQSVLLKRDLTPTQIFEILSDKSQLVFIFLF